MFFLPLIDHSSARGWPFSKSISLSTCPSSARHTYPLPAFAHHAVLAACGDGSTAKAFLHIVWHPHLNIVCSKPNFLLLSPPYHSGIFFSGTNYESVLTLHSSQELPSVCLATWHYPHYCFPCSSFQWLVFINFFILFPSGSSYYYFAQLLNWTLNSVEMLG